MTMRSSIKRFYFIALVFEVSDPQVKTFEALNCSVRILVNLNKGRGYVWTFLSY